MRIVLPSHGGISVRSVYDADQEDASPATMARGAAAAGGGGTEVDDLGERTGQARQPL